MEISVNSNDISRPRPGELFINESNNVWAPESVIEPETLSIEEKSESACITPFLSARSSRDSLQSVLTITPTDWSKTAYVTPRSSLSFDTPSSQFYSFATNSESNRTATNSPLSSAYETCIGASARLLDKTKSLRRFLSTGLLLNKLQRAPRRLYTCACDDNPDSCKCQADSFDRDCLKKFMEMSTEYRTTSHSIMTSTPVINKDVYDQGIFNVARIRKVELQELAPKVAEYNGIEKFVDEPISDRCINNNNLRTPNGNHYNNQLNAFVSSITPICTKNQQPTNLVTVAVPEDGNVLKKVITFTLDQKNNADYVNEKTSRPTFVPEKLHFSAYQQFKGQVFVNWLSTSMTQSNQMSEIDLDLFEKMVTGFCSHLIAAGVMRQILDQNEIPLQQFSPNAMYQWTYLQKDGPKNQYPTYKVQSVGDQGGSNEYISTIPVNCNGQQSCDNVNKHLPNGNDVQPISSDHDNLDTKETEDREYTKPRKLCSESDEAKLPQCDIKIYLESSTQTDDITTEASPERHIQKVQKMMTCTPTLTPPPPPPMPSPLFHNSNEVKEESNPVVEKKQSNLPVPETVPQTHNQSVINTSTTILSSASSFCSPPPPPMPGPPPLPLPTGNMWFQSDTLRKAAKHPPKPMINLFWTRILVPKDDDEVESKSASECDSLSLRKREKLWQKIDETVLENADDFTSLFARQATPKRPREVAKLPKKTVIKVLDHKRSQSVGIFSQSLYRHRIDPPVIQQALYNWDLSKVSLDLLHQLVEHKATEDELKAINDALKTSTTSIPLDGPEHFLLKLSEISCAPERIACIIFRSEFDEANAHIEQKIKTVHSVCEFLMENDNLGDLFAIILTLGNFMNGGNRYRGQADGFGLDVLNKLRDVKSKDKKITLLHFIVKTFINKRRQNGLKLKEIVYPLPDADDVRSVSNVNFEMLNEQIKQLDQNLCDIKAKMEFVIESSTEENIQPFKDISEEFVQAAMQRIDSQFQQLAVCRIVFRETLDYFKHMPKTGTIDECTPSQFFELWVNFSIDFRDLWKKEFAAIQAEVIQKHKTIASPKTPLRVKGKQKPSGLRVRRVNQI